MGAALWDIHRPAVAFAELRAEPPPVRGRFGAQIDDDVENRPARAANQLLLGMRLALDVHAAQRALPLIALHIALLEHGIDSGGGELPFACDTREKAAIIPDRFGIDEKRSFDGRRCKNHNCNLLARGETIENPFRNSPSAAYRRVYGYPAFGANQKIAGIGFLKIHRLIPINPKERLIIPQLYKRYA